MFDFGDPAGGPHNRPFPARRFRRGRIKSLEIPQKGRSLNRTSTTDRPTIRLLQIVLKEAPPKFNGGTRYSGVEFPYFRAAVPFASKLPEPLAGAPGCRTRPVVEKRNGSSRFVYVRAGVEILLNIFSFLLNICPNIIV